MRPDVLLTENSNNEKIFEGTVSRVEIAHGFITIDGRGDDIFFHKNNVDNNTWNQTRNTSRVIFNLGFAFGGPVAINIKIT
jgi:cold shock CspA family protein